MNVEDRPYFAAGVLQCHAAKRYIEAQKGEDDE